jgi:uncharacterized LabA/DUF88 family protein
MKKTAVLLDLGFTLQRLYNVLGGRYPTAIEVREFAQRCLGKDEELFRIYCYHCLPYTKTRMHPLSKTQIDFGNTPTGITMAALIKDLKVTNNVAFRAGELNFAGWKIKWRSAMELIKTGRSLLDTDFAPDLKQKGVDMKIGLDVAWLSSKRIVDRIILVAADSDFVPAMKFARREGVQVILVTLGHKQVRQEVLEHADELRVVAYP